jgi:DtxR family Mn-dependent transcriptional regulator
LNRLAQADLAEMNGRSWKLTPEGHNAALYIVRAHRLWERHLAENTGYGETEWHQRAELAEHELLPADADELAAQLGYPTHDPHGDPIPDAEGHFVAHGGQPLSAWPLNRPGRIVHVEDEPEAIYAQLLAEGLYPGMEVTMLEATPQRVRFWANGDEHVLAPIVAANVSIAAIARNSVPPAPTGPLLASLSVGEKGKVTQLSPRCRGAERRRMMDLGILPGAVIGAELVSPSGGTTAYRIRDALIALRPEQANLIHIQPLMEAQ